MSNILNPRGQQWAELGGDRCWVHNGQTMQRVKGDICVSYQWIEIPGKRDPQPCMVLFPVHLKADCGAYVIPQDNAYEYSDHSGQPTVYLATAVRNAAITMGFFPDDSTLYRIMDIVVEGLADLIRMPSDQPDSFNIKRMVQGIEATVKAGGQVVREEVL